MAIVMSSTEFIARAKQAAASKTLYVMGGIGYPLTAAMKVRAIDSYPYNRQPSVMKTIQAASSDTFAFDCVNLLKSILWGWCGDTSAIYGGAVYCSNGVPDTNEKGMLQSCTKQSIDFSNILPGEMLYLPGHVGIYIGNGLAIESTPAWENKVQVTAVLNIGLKARYPGRKWDAHGQLPWINYNNQPTPEPIPTDLTFTFSELQIGSVGSDVKVLQTVLKGLNFKDKNKKVLVIDGEFGECTYYALCSFQKSAGIAVDGIAGPDTWNHLLYRR